MAAHVELKHHWDLLVDALLLVLFYAAAILYIRIMQTVL